MAKFKKGDTVLCVEGGDYSALTNGKYYTVLSVYDDDFVDIENDKGIVFTARPDRFKLPDTNEPQFDAVKKPKHYNQGKYEPRPVVQDWLTYTPLPKGTANWVAWAMKYLFRAGLKDNTVQDLRKAINYLEYAITTLEENNE